MENTNRPECLPATFENGDVTTTRVDRRTPAEWERWSAPAWTDRDEKQLEELFPGMVTFHLDPLPPTTLVAEGHGLREPGLMAEAVAGIPGAVLIEDFDPPPPTAPGPVTAVLFPSSNITAEAAETINAMMTEATKDAEFKPVVEGAIVPGDLTVMCADTSERAAVQAISASYPEAWSIVQTKDGVDVNVPSFDAPTTMTAEEVAESYVWLNALANEADSIAHRARQIELPRLPTHAERTAANKARREAAAAAPFQSWKCVRCGSEITTAEEAADHRKLNLIGRGACRRAARAIREEARAALGQKPKKRRAAGPRGYVYETPDRTFWPTKFEQNGATVSYDDVESHVRRLGHIPVDPSPGAA